MHRAIALAALFTGVACKDATSSTFEVDGSVDANAGSNDSSFSQFPDVSDGAGDEGAQPPTVEDAAPGVGLDATDLDAAGPDPSAAPCEGSDAGSCGFPPSACADGRWLVYYDDGRCVSGQCVWEERYIDCSPLGCFYGACRVPVTR
jgi:hypothetical protein